MMPFTLRIPRLPPSTNHAFITVGNRRVLSKDARVFKEMVGWLLQVGPKPLPRITDHVSVSMDFYSKKWLTKGGAARHIDLGNLEKLCLDAIFEALGADDSLVWTLTLRKLDGPEESVIRITPLDGVPESSRL